MSDTDGYYYRDKEGECVGPISKSRFSRLKANGTIDSSSRAWRTKGGQAYKVIVENKLVWDAKHIYSFKSCSHIFEICTLTITLSMTAGIFWVIDWEKERKANGGRSSAWLIGIMFFVSIVLAGFTMRKVASRWRKVAAETFVSEV